MKILTIIGTRPEALKMGPVLHALTRAGNVESLVCATGQHRELLQQALALFAVRPDFSLELRRRSSSPEELLACLLRKLGSVVAQVRPDWVLAVGDTTSVLGASLVAAHQGVRFGHVEAGLRTDCLLDPFPEEFNRRVASVLADLHFAPTRQAMQNLRKENIPARRIVVTGNPIIDTLKYCSAQPEPGGLSPLWRQLGLAVPDETGPRLVVVTFHRRENHGRPIRNICAALRQLARIYRGNVRIFCVLHPNPAVREPARRALAGVRHLVLSRPLNYLAMIAVLKRAHLILTDSGGLQEEAPALRVPVLVLRNRTERPEAVAAGAAKIIGTATVRIVAEVRRVLDDPATHAALAQGFNGYGDGAAAGRIVRAILGYEGGAAK